MMFARQSFYFVYHTGSSDMDQFFEVCLYFRAEPLSLGRAVATLVEYMMPQWIGM